MDLRRFAKDFCNQLVQHIIHKLLYRLEIVHFLRGA